MFLFQQYHVPVNLFIPVPLMFVIKKQHVSSCKQTDLAHSYTISSQTETLILAIPFFNQKKLLKKSTTGTKTTHIFTMLTVLNNMHLFCIKPNFQHTSNQEQTQTLILAIPFFNDLFSLKITFCNFTHSNYLIRTF